MAEAKTAIARQAPPQTSIRELISVAGRLVGIMRRETSALRSVSMATLPALVAEKAALMDAFTKLSRGFRHDPETIAAVTEALRGELEEAFAIFEETVRENERALVAARDANERVLRAVVSAAEAQRPRAQGYGRTGLAPAPARSGDRKMVPVAIDRRL
jgi:hypothetical protein